MMVHMRVLLLLLLSFGLFSPAIAAPNHIRAMLVAESRQPAAGRAVTLALAMQPEPGWHGYWKNTGDAGFETRLDWRLPGGVTAGPLAYPVPQRLNVAGLMNYVIEGPYAHLIRLTIPAGLRPGTPLRISADANWLACTDKICVPERGTLNLNLVVGDGSVSAVDRARFDRWRAALPRPLGQVARFERKGGLLRLAIPLPAAYPVSEPYFFPQTPDVIKYAAPQSISRAGDRLIVEVAAGSAMPRAIEGVLATGKGQGLSLRAVPGTVPAAGIPVASGDDGAPDATFPTILLSFAAAVLGGMLLNVMPCVFPILSLKALSLARAGETAAQARQDALAYAAGVILVCAALGGLLLALRSGGAALGWAFQLQDPRVILLLLLLVSAIAFNLSGLFELPSVGIASGPAGTFWTGALAAFVATPCTGPFMAAALGAALVLPVTAAMAIFLGLGLGIALPFLALGFVPAFRRMLPRPGPWLATMRHILSVPMFVTALGLAWILGRQAGVNGLVVGLAAMLLLGLALWWGGARQRNGRSGPFLPALPMLAAACALAFAVPQTVAVAGERAENAFSEAKLAALRATGAPVFVYFTADWCLTCKVNEKTAIDREEVDAAFARAGIEMLVGDWTRGDPEIGRFLARHGRSGVPFYLFYPRGGGDPRELPQLLTPLMLIELAG